MQERGSVSRQSDISTMLIDDIYPVKSITMFYVLTRAGKTHISYNSTWQSSISSFIRECLNPEESTQCLAYYPVTVCNKKVT